MIIIQFKLHVLTLAGDLLVTFTPEPDPIFGVRSVAWHPNGMFLIAASWDDRVCIPTKYIKFSSIEFAVDVYPRKH